jgi:hypothetical protein
MLALSFRDMTVNVHGAVLPAQIYDMGDISATHAWTQPKSFPWVPWDKVGAHLAGKHVCFVVHGFNVDRNDGYTGLGTFAQELSRDSTGKLKSWPAPNGPLDMLVADIDLFVPLLWAGDWYLPFNYPFLLPDIRQTAGLFSDFIYSRDTSLKKISFITHSMGARLCLESLQHVMDVGKQNPDLVRPQFGDIILMAAAASDQVLDDPDYADAVAAVGAGARFIIVSSVADMVLELDFPVGNLVENALWKNDWGEDIALGRDGPILVPDSKARDFTDWYPLPVGTGVGEAANYDHGDYLPSPLDPPADPDAWPNGWSARSAKIGQLCQALLVTPKGITPFSPTQNLP